MNKQTRKFRVFSTFSNKPLFLDKDSYFSWTATRNSIEASDVIDKNN